MSSDEIEFEDVEDALRRAEELAELTGREKKDIIADLLDDGVLNKSAGEDAEEKKDFLDKAQEQAEKLKTLLTTLIPIFALLMGIGAEGLGVLDLTDWGSESIWEDDNQNSIEGCDPFWNYDEYGYLDDNNLEVRFTFQDYNNCGIEHYGGHFIITLFESGDEKEQVFINNIDFIDYSSIEHTFMDLEGGDYHYRVEFHVVECEDGSCEHGDEYYLPTSNQYYIEAVESCDAYFINEQAYILEDDVERDAVRISADVALVEGASNCDSEQFEITWRLYKNNEVSYEHKTWENGEITDSDGADYTSHTWNDVDVGTYTPKIILKLNGDNLDDKWIAQTISIEEQSVQGCTDSEATNYNNEATEDDGSCEYPEPEDPCDVEIHNHYRGHVAEDEEQDAILISFRVVPSNCEDEMVEIDVELYQNGYDANYSHWVEINGDAEYTDVSHTFDGVAIGNSWTPRITASLDGEELEQVLFWGIDVLEQEPDTCEINLFGITLLTNNTTATVGFDLDCGYEENDLEGYNVSVQFLIYRVNETNSGANGTGPLAWITQLYYIEGYADDVRTLTLDNFTVENTTRYDFYWYAIWTDADGDQQYIEQNWLNRELNE